MNRNIFTLALLAGLSTVALASPPGNNGGGNGGCGNGQTTNGCGTAPTTNHGGAGGQGGAGGTGVGIAGAAASSKSIAAQQQGQAQGQLQGQAQTAKTGDVAVTITGATESQRPVASAIATGLVASNGTCMGSTSAGAQGVTIGLSVGTTWTDSACDARYDAQALTALGQPVAALARLCQKAEIAAAVEATGQKCPSSKPAMKTAGYTGNDPIVKARLGIAQ